MNRTILFYALLLPILVLSFEVQAQDQRVEISDGRVTVDGRLLPATMLPEQDLTGVEASIRLPESGSILLQLEGRTYRIDANGLHEVTRGGDAHDSRASGAPSAVVAVQDAAIASAAVASGRPDAVVISRQADQLRARARELQKLTVEMQQNSVQSTELFRMIESIQQSAAETEQVARALPHLHAERYLQEVRENNSELYERLVREQALEHETLQLSVEIRNLAEGSDRHALVERLRSRLDDIFQMKQDNRRREINGIEERLESLRHRHEKRERYRERIIEKRLKELAGEVTHDH